jgi:hypothetical protein
MNERHKPNPRMEIIKDGAYRVISNVPVDEQKVVTNAEGESLEYERDKDYPAPPQYNTRSAAAASPVTGRSVMERMQPEGAQSVDAYFGQ